MGQALRVRLVVTVGASECTRRCDTTALGMTSSVAQSHREYGNVSVAVSYVALVLIVLHWKRLRRLPLPACHLASSLESIVFRSRLAMMPESESDGTVGAKLSKKALCQLSVPAAVKCAWINPHF
jgi:hypothetical protein